ncbi:MAG: type IV pilus twitching motility protein PilT [Patescibacteria group bacterium]
MNIKEILQIAVQKKASDLHLIVGLSPILRIDGNLIAIKNYKKLAKKDLEQMALSLLNDGQKKKFVANRNLDFSFSLENKARFRINLHYEKNNIGLTARVINEQILSLKDIGVPKITYDLLNSDHGLILVTGPTGCGKSTTLAAMINYINENYNRSIITLEDPIEFIFKPSKSIIIQRELGSDILSFQDGLKYAMRQDPNIIMVGEMRDLETISAAVTLAETGHLVLATLHTCSSAQTVDRIIDIFPPHQQNQIKTQLSTALKAVIAQKLLPKINGGRIAAREIMINTPAIANLIRENKTSQIKTVIETSSKDGMMSLEQNLKELKRNQLIN